MSVSSPSQASGSVARRTSGRRSGRPFLVKVLAVGAAALALSLAGAGPAFAQTPSPAPSPQQATPTEKAAAEVRPAIVYLTETFSGYVADESGTYFNNGNPYQLSVTCTGFGVNPDGYIATAGHCVDITSPNGIREEFIATVAREVVASIPNVTLAEAIEFGNANWTVEGKAKGSPIDSQISVITGSIQGGAKGQALPARVVDSRPFDQGDVALLKVETNDLPSIELASDADVQVGTPLLSIGYPASADAVTDPSLEPSNKDGQVSSKKTVGSVPVYETSAALTPGMSGGPTVDLNGRVLGLNSFMPSGESQAFNFIAPASGLSELLSRNGIRGELGPDDKAFRAALESYYAGHYTDAIAGFDKLLQVAPQHAQAIQFRTLAAKARDKFGDTPVAPAPAPSSGLPLGLSPVAFWSAVGGALAITLSLVLLTVLVRRGRRSNGPESMTLPPALPPTPFPGYGAIPAQQQPPRAEKVLAQPMSQAPMWPGATPSAPTVDLSTVNGSAQAQAPVLTAQREDCTRCGTRMDAAAHFCSTCGQPRS